MRVAGILPVALALLTVAGRAHAQVTETKQALTLEGARIVAAAAEAEAKKGHEGASIAIVDDGGNLMYLERLPPTFPMGATISTEKAKTAALFQKPTKILEDAIVGGRTPLLNAVVRAAQRRRADPGGRQGRRSHRRERRVERGQRRGHRPRRRRRAQRQDQRGQVGVLSMRLPTPIMLAAVLAVPFRAGQAQSDDSRVTLISRDRVESAFARGMPMIEVPDYKIHASRREGPGQVEIHTRDTDIAYVLQGTATLVTGGEPIDMKTIAPEELRGRGIEGGETRQLAPGDVVVIPNGVPHWFKEVKPPSSTMW